MRFAGTGHLVIATAHAGSLIEAMERIFRGVNAKTAAQRGQIAQRILAVIHQLKFDLIPVLQRHTACMLPGKFEMLLPALWRRTPSGVAALVSDGLSSVLPNTPDEDDEKRISSFGRRWFARNLARKHIDDGTWEEIVTRKSNKSSSQSPEPLALASTVNSVRDHFELEAIRYDLMGI